MIQIDFISFFSSFFTSLFTSLFFFFFPLCEIQLTQPQLTQPQLTQSQLTKTQQYQNNDISDKVRNFTANYNRDVETLKKEKKNPSQNRIDLINACNNVLDKKISSSKTHQTITRAQKKRSKNTTFTPSFTPTFPRII